MNTSFFNNCFRKLSLCLAAMLILLLSSISINSDIYAGPIHKTRVGVALHKKQPEPRMFLIAVIDSHDDSIGKRCEIDLGEIKDAFEGYADEIGANMADLKIIEGDGFSKTAVTDVINNWLPSQHLQNTDIVIFYYSGHGFRYPQDVGNFPRMWLKQGNDKNVENNNLRIKEDIYDRIVKMGAGFNLVLSDCCNSTYATDNVNYDNVAVPARKRGVHNQEHSKDEKSAEDIDNADRLFIPGHPLSILATAAGKGELAGGTDDIGGFFTWYLVDALDACIYDEKLEPDWKTIFRYADDKAGYWARSAACPAAKHNENGRCVQTAEIKIDNTN